MELKVPCYVMLCICYIMFVFLKVNCPIDEGYDGFWTDFNIGSQSISFFARENDDQVILDHTNTLCSIIDL